MIHWFICLHLAQLGALLPILLAWKWDVLEFVHERIKLFADSVDLAELNSFKFRKICLNIKRLRFFVRLQSF